MKIKFKYHIATLNFRYYIVKYAKYRYQIRNYPKTNLYTRKLLVSRNKVCFEIKKLKVTTGHMIWWQRCCTKILVISSLNRSNFTLMYKKKCWKFLLLLEGSFRLYHNMMSMSKARHFFYICFCMNLS